MSGTLTQAPTRRTTHGTAAAGTNSSDHLTHLPRAPRRTTPNLLRAGAAGAGVLALVAALVLGAAASGARSQIGAVRGTDAPSVRAANDFLFKLQDMDAQLVNVLLVNGDGSVHVPRATSEALYDKDRQDADADLEAATVALAGSPDALARLHGVTDAFGQYQAQATRTMADDEREGGIVAGAASSGIVGDYLTGNGILFGQDGTGGLMAQAQALERSGKDAIGASAHSADDSLDTALGEFLIFGALLVGGLVALQVFVFRRFHRVVNPALAGATVTALILMIGGAAGAASAADDFHTAKSGAFDSVLALGEAAALSAGINADESRWLLAHDQPEQRARFDASYVQDAEQVAAIDVRQGAADYDGSLADANSQVLAAIAVGDLSAGTLSATVLTKDSAFGREFRNITFEGEADAAATAFRDYTAYLLDDSTLRRMPLATPTQLKTAIDFDTNADTPNTSDQAFTAYSKALADVVAINQAHFDSAMPAAENGMGTWIWLPSVLVALMIALTVLGLRPRLVEYR